MDNKSAGLVAIPHRGAGKVWDVLDRDFLLFVGIINAVEFNLSSSPAG
jgi:hypothetical protein